MADNTAQQPRRLTVEAVVIRADGTRENLGVVASNDPAAPGDARVHKPDSEGVANG